MQTDIEYALRLTIEALYFGDTEDYEDTLGQISELLGGREAAELLRHDPDAAWRKYCPRLDSDEPKRNFYVLQYGIN